MPRKATNQWAFGELFADQELRTVLTVAQLTGRVRQLLEERIGTIWVSGEVTNLRVQASGHAYFALKDSSAQLSCVLFRGVANASRGLLDNGVMIIAQGELTVYDPRGQYQLVVRELELQGAGALQVAFEKLKRELDALGYFAAARKRPLPRLPERIGLVTSATGAALRDVLHVIQRRQPSLEIILAACRVQGDGAGAEIAEALDDLNHWSQQQPKGRGLDLVLITRGGGSLEDLWAFNERVVAEAIFRSALPVVSAIGHEIDFTISDFVADLRAATPSAAAEIITESAHASRFVILEAQRSMARACENRVSSMRELSQSIRKRLDRCRPTRLLHERMQYVDEFRERAVRIVRARLRSHLDVHAVLLGRFLRIKPESRLTKWRFTLGDLIVALRRIGNLRLQALRTQLQTASSQLRILSPTETLARGYSITTNATGTIIRSAQQAQAGELIQTRLSDGTIESRVLSKGKAPDQASPDSSKLNITNIVRL